MRKISYILIVVVLIIAPSLECIVAINNNSERATTTSSEHYGKGYRYNTHGWIYLHIGGEPYERGYQHGYLLAEEIVDVIQRWNHIFPQKWSWNVQRRTAVRLFWNKYPDEYKQEIQGIADGVSARDGMIEGNPVTYKDILTLNQIYEMGTRNRNYFIYPLRSSIRKMIRSFQNTEGSSEEHEGHCSVFIATGDATVDGRIVAAHSTVGGIDEDVWWHNYVVERWNVVLDIEPTQGYRFLMTTSPGLIWSDEDFYQSSAGMILMETTLPLGTWRRRGTPAVVRARTAIQYSDSIDEIVQTFLERNNGLMANDWVIGDIKTGEIASLELALHNHALRRTTNGFFWSCNNPKDDRVRWELYSPFGFGVMGKLLGKKFEPNRRDLQFEELRNKYYGKIDIDVAKKIMSTKPIATTMFDCKITDSHLVTDFGIWAYMGYPYGTDFIASEKPLGRETPGYTDMPSCGWVSLYALTSKNIQYTEHSLAIELEDSRALWDFETKTGELGNAIYSSPIVANGSLFTTSWNGDIYALDVESGRKQWETPIGWSSEAPPCVVDDVVFAGSSDGIVALNAKTGEIRWEKTIGAVSSQPCYVEGVVYCGSHDGNLYALDADRGTIKWTYTTGSDIYSSPTVDTSIVYIGSNDGSLYAIDCESGEKLWSYTTRGPVCSSPQVYDDVVYVGSWDNTLYAIDRKTGATKWTYTTGWGIDSSPAIYEDTLFVGSRDTNLYAIDIEEGALKWVFSTHGGIKSSPTVYGGFVFFGSSDGKLYALNAEDGILEWSASPDYHIEGIYNYVTKPIDSSPVAYDGNIFVGSTNGKVYCLDAQTVEQPKRDEDIEIPLETWLFTAIPLLCVILATALYLLWERRELT